MSQHQYLGVITHCWAKDDGHNNAHVLPVARVIQDKLIAVELKDVVNEFPSRGKVTWFDSEYERGDYILFSPRNGGTFDPQQGKLDQRIIDRDCLPPEPIREVLDYFDDGVNLREQFVEDGVAVAPLGNTVYIRLDMGRIAGPVELQHENGIWRLDRERLNTSPLMVFEYNEKADSLRFDNRTFLAASRPRRSGQVDWADPQIVLVRALSRISRLGLPVAGSLPGTKRAIDELAEKLSSLEFAPLDRQRVLDAKRYLSQLDEDIHLSSELIDDLLLHPQISKNLAERREMLLQEARQEAERILKEAKGKARQSTQDLERQVSVLTDRIRAKTIQLERIDAKIEAQKQHEQETLDQQLKEFQTALSQKVDDILDEPARVLADLAIYRAAFHEPRNGSERAAEPRTHRIAIHYPITMTEARRIDLAAARKESRAFITPASVAWLFRTLLSGAVPVVPEASSYQTIQALEQCLVGGASLRIHIPPTLTTVSQLLINQEADAVAAPSSSGLPDLLLQAFQEPDRLFLIVLEGVNRAAIALYLIPLLQLYASEVSSLRLFRPEQMSPENPFIQLANLTWPRNVLLLVTMADLNDDFTALPVPKQFWHYAIPLVPHMRSRRLSLKEDTLPSYVTMTDWRSHWPDVSGELHDAVHQLQQDLLDEGIQLDEPVLWNMSRFANAEMHYDPEAEGTHFRHWLSVVAPNAEADTVRFAVEEFV